MTGTYVGAGDLPVAAVISVVRDTDKAWTVTLLDGAGADFDTTADGGWDVEAEMREEIDGALIALTWSVAISGASNNIATISATAAQLADVEPGCYFVDVRLSNQSDARIRRPNLSPAGRAASHIVQANVRGRITAG